MACRIRLGLALASRVYVLENKPGRAQNAECGSTLTQEGALAHVGAHRDDGVALGIYEVTYNAERVGTNLL